MSKISLAAAHLNAPYQNKVTVEELASALRTGTLQLDTIRPRAAAIITDFFLETSINLIFACIAEAGTDIETANNLYLEIISDNIPRSIEWEEAVEHLLPDRPSWTSYSELPKTDSDFIQERPNIIDKGRFH